MYHRELCVWILYRKHMIVNCVRHQAVQTLAQRGKRVIRSSWYTWFHEALLCWNTKIPMVTVEIMQLSGYIDGIFCIILDFKHLDSKDLL